MKYMIPFNRDFYHSPKYAELLAIQQEAFTAYVTGAVNDPEEGVGVGGGTSTKGPERFGRHRQGADGRISQTQLK